MPIKKKNKARHRVTERPPNRLVQLRDGLNHEKAQLEQAQTDDERDYYNKKIRALERMI